MAVLHPADASAAEFIESGNPIMADKDARLPDNAEGAFYVDENCSDSGICREIAPDIFKHKKSAGSSYVARQPQNGEERALCMKAMKACPLAAIGNDGEA